MASHFPVHDMGLRGLLGGILYVTILRENFPTRVGTAIVAPTCSTPYGLRYSRVFSAR